MPEIEGESHIITLPQKQKMAKKEKIEKRRKNPKSADRTISSICSFSKLQ
jgi:hypothetical protein